MVDYPGRLAVVLFLGGCNFRCGFCHNPDLMKAPAQGKGLPWHDVERLCKNFRENWTDGAVVTGGEPTLSPELFHTVKKLRTWGFAVKLDTNGSRPDQLEPLLPLLNLVAMDIKFAPEDYPAHTGFSNLAALTRSIDMLKNNANACEFRTTVVQAWHTEEKLMAMGQWLMETGGGEPVERWVLQAFQPRPNLPDPACRTMPETPREVLHAMADLLRPYARHVEIRGEF